MCEQRLLARFSRGAPFSQSLYIHTPADVHDQSRRVAEITPGQGKDDFSHILRVSPPILGDQSLGDEAIVLILNRLSHSCSDDPGTDLVNIDRKLGKAVGVEPGDLTQGALETQYSALEGEERVAEMEEMKMILLFVPECLPASSIICLAMH